MSVLNSRINLCTSCTFCNKKRSPRRRKGDLFSELKHEQTVRLPSKEVEKFSLHHNYSTRDARVKSYFTKKRSPLADQGSRKQGGDDKWLLLIRVKPERNLYELITIIIVHLTRARVKCKLIKKEALISWKTRTSMNKGGDEGKARKELVLSHHHY